MIGNIIISDFNVTHPELQQGEMFVTNSTMEHLDTIGWKTKRTGKIAYDIGGKEIHWLVPVFRQSNEVFRLHD